MALYLLAVIAGFVFLTWGADYFVRGAAAIARYFHVSSLVIGLTVVGLATSAPEILVSALAALAGTPGLAIGNAIGSNIANIGLIVGLTALLVPVTVQSTVLKREFPLLLLVTLFSGLLILDYVLDFFDAILLLVGLLMLLFWMVRQGRGRCPDPLQSEYEEKLAEPASMPWALLWLSGGFGVLLASSKVLVWGAVGVAGLMGVSDLLIGLTIVALGTSLPELATSIMAVVRREPDVAIGNVIGSNMYNMLAVLSIPGLFGTVSLAAEAVVRDFAVMGILTMLLFVMAFSTDDHCRIGRAKGAVLLLIYVGYQGWIVTVSG